MKKGSFVRFRDPQTQAWRWGRVHQILPDGTVGVLEYLHSSQIPNGAAVETLDLGTRKGTGEEGAHVQTPAIGAEERRAYFRSLSRLWDTPLATPSHGRPY